MPSRNSERCAECHICKDLSKFHPRKKEQADAALSRGEVWLQPRCRDCSRIYGNRVRAFRRLRKVAERDGLELLHSPGSCYRIWNVRLPSGLSNVPSTIREGIGAFNAALPDDRCDVARHGVTLRMIRQPDPVMPLFR